MVEWAFFGKVCERGNYGEVLWKGEGKVLVKSVDINTQYVIVSGYIQLLDEDEVIICASKEKARELANLWWSETSQYNAKITVARKSIDNLWDKLKK